MVPVSLPHDIAGEVLGIDLDDLSRWQLAALALEAIMQIENFADPETYWGKKIRSRAAGLIEKLTALRNFFD